MIETMRQAMQQRKDFSYDNLAAALRHELGEKWSQGGLRSFASRVIINGEYPRRNRRYYADQTEEPRYRALALVLGIDPDQFVSWVTQQQKHRFWVQEMVRDEPCIPLTQLLIRVSVQYAATVPTPYLAVTTRLISILTSLLPQAIEGVLIWMTSRPFDAHAGSIALRNYAPLVVYNSHTSFVTGSREYIPNMWEEAMNRLSAAILQDFEAVGLTFCEASNLAAVIGQFEIQGPEKVRQLSDALDRVEKRTEVQQMNYTKNAGST